MKSDAFGIGILCLIIGVILFLWSSDQINHLEKFYLLSKSASSQIQTYEVTKYFGAALGILGMVLTMSGITGTDDDDDAPSTIGVIRDPPKDDDYDPPSTIGVIRDPPEWR